MNCAQQLQSWKRKRKGATYSSATHDFARASASSDVVTTVTNAESVSSDVAPVAPTQRPVEAPPKPAVTAGPQYISVVVEDNSGAGWPDKISEAFYIVEGNVVRLCHSDGRMLDDDKWRHVLMAYENPKVAAERLLKQRAGVLTPFSATKLKYHDPGMI
jgi:hypothetical protein